jgi:hypothetical protein
MRAPSIVFRFGIFVVQLATVSSQAVVCFRGPLKIGIAFLVGPRLFRFTHWSWRSSCSCCGRAIRLSTLLLTARFFEFCVHNSFSWYLLFLRGRKVIFSLDLLSRWNSVAHDCSPLDKYHHRFAGQPSLVLIYFSLQKRQFTLFA